MYMLILNKWCFPPGVQFAKKHLGEIEIAKRSHSNWVYIEIAEWFIRLKKGKILRVLKLMLQEFTISDIALN